MKKALNFVLAFLLILSFVANLVSADTNAESDEIFQNYPSINETVGDGSWGDNINWTLTHDGNLYISGQGEFPEGISPWAQLHSSKIYYAEIAEGITYIGDFAFSDCINLQMISMPDSVEYISESAFVGCDFDGWLTFSCSEGSYACEYAFSHMIPVDGQEVFGRNEMGYITDGLWWELYGGHTTLYIYGDGEIPDYLSDYAPWHEYADSITSIDISEGITNIGDFAFQDCINLRYVYIPDSVKSISENAFAFCDPQKFVIYCNEDTAAESFANEYSFNAEVTRFDKSGKCGENIEWTLSDGVLRLSGRGNMEDHYSFNIRFDKVTKIIVGDGITSVGTDAFSYFLNVKEIELSDSVEKIKANAFRECTSLEKIKLPENLESIGDWAFADCLSLSQIEFPKELEKIGESAFAYCESLESVHLLEEIERIDAEAFSYCTNLKEVYLPSEIKRLGAHTFAFCSDELVIHGIKGSKIEKYAKENGIEFEEIPFIDVNDEIVTVPAIKPDVPPRELTGAEKVVNSIADNIILILCGLCLIILVLIIIIILAKIQRIKAKKEIQKILATEAEEKNPQQNTNIEE